MGSLEKISNFYSNVLLTSDYGGEALKYLLSRGFSTETLESFEVGFSPDVVVDYIESGILKYSDLANLEELEHLFIRTDGKYSDKFKGRITFPLKTAEGKVLGFAARSINGDFPKYVNSAESRVYRKSACLFGLNLAFEHIYDRNFAILCEGYTDAVAFHQTDNKVAVACGGTYASDYQLALIGRYTKNLILAFDADDAGDAVTDRTYLLAKSMGFKVKLLEFERGKDPAEVLLSS